MRPIDAELFDFLSWEDDEHGTTFMDGVAWVCRLIDNAPTIELEKKKKHKKKKKGKKRKK